VCPRQQDWSMSVCISRQASKRGALREMLISQMLGRTQLSPLPHLIFSPLSSALCACVCVCVCVFTCVCTCVPTLFLSSYYIKNLDPSLRPWHLALCISAWTLIMHTNLPTMLRPNANGQYGVDMASSSEHVAPL
jgi:hypothetical protein